MTEEEKKAKVLARRRELYQQNRAKELERKKLYRMYNGDKLNKYQEEYRAKKVNKEKAKEYQEQYREGKTPRGAYRTKAEIKYDVDKGGKLPDGVKRYSTGREPTNRPVGRPKKIRTPEELRKEKRAKERKENRRTMGKQKFEKRKKKNIDKYENEILERKNKKI